LSEHRWLIVFGRSPVIRANSRCERSRSFKISFSLIENGVTLVQIYVTEEEKIMNVIGYIRVSTQGQARDGYSFVYQEDEIKAYCQAQGYTPLRLFKDEGISGAKVDEEALEVDRIGFQEMLEYLSTMRWITLSH
jgi:hypothetical protein